MPDGADWVVFHARGAYEPTIRESQRPAANPRPGPPGPASIRGHQPDLLRALVEQNPALDSRERRAIPRSHSSVAQLVERATVNRLVIGSSPIAGASARSSQELGGLFCFCGVGGAGLEPTVYSPRCAGLRTGVGIRQLRGLSSATPCRIPTPRKSYRSSRTSSAVCDFAEPNGVGWLQQGSQFGSGTWARARD